MATPQEKLAESLDALRELQDRGIVAIRAADLSRAHRERLLKNSFLQEVMKGWYIAARPDDGAVKAQPGMPHSGLFAPLICANALAVSFTHRLE
jgi:hypothetical protein